jgi:hypothetical protein
MGALAKFNRELMEVSAEKGFWLRILGSIEGNKIWLVRTRDYYVPDYDHKDLKLLIGAGWHGEEPAGPWAILEWLKRCDQTKLEKLDLSFIPLVNPTGFKKNTRAGVSGMRPNRGYCHQREMKEVPSPEDQILIDHVDLLRPLAQNGLITLHEDNVEKSFYIYTYEHGTEPGAFTVGLKKEMKNHFPKWLHGTTATTSADRTEGLVIQEGVVFRLCDGAFEDWMFHMGVPKVATIETPGRYRLKRRVEAGVAIIDKFIKLCGEE